MDSVGNHFKLLEKYKGLQFHDQEVDINATFIISEANLEFTKASGYTVIAEDTDPNRIEPYCINDELHDMIRDMAQADGIELVQKPP